MSTVQVRLRRLVINWTRRLRRRPRSRITRVVYVRGRQELPTTLNPRSLYQLGAPAKWAVFECPCGRGHLLELNLGHADRARWTISIGRADNPSISPSVDFKGDRRCHFWLRDGRVHWV